MVRVVLCVMCGGVLCVVSTTVGVGLCVWFVYMRCSCWVGCLMGWSLGLGIWDVLCLDLLLVCDSFGGLVGVLFVS